MVTLALTLTLAAALAPQSPDQDPSDEYFKIIDLPKPDNISLEVGGIITKGPDLIVSTRRGEVWYIKNAYTQTPEFQLWAEGLQEPLGLLEHDGWIYVAQRGELSRMRDVDGDHRMDELETVNDDWVISGNYHEYCFGPTLMPDGSMWLTLNKPFGGEPFGKVDWRGWAVRITKDGKFEPVCAGLRSPAGVATSPFGEVFYTDNQGEWCATSKFAHLQVGDFHGHPHGIESAKRPESLVEFPGDVPSGLRIDEAARTIKNYTLPTVWIPYNRVGRSPGGFVWDTAGHFGPYRGQIFCGDQYSSEVFRMTMEKVKGRWQGACYPFRKGLKCGIIRVAWGTDGSLWCGQTNRGWPSLGPLKDGLQRIQWTGKKPFDLLEVTALPKGFRLKFTSTISPASILPPSFEVESWTYDHHSAYGCPERDNRVEKITSTALSADGMTIDITLDGLMDTRIYRISTPGVLAEDGRSPWNADAFYTRNQTPE